MDLLVYQEIEVKLVCLELKDHKVLLESEESLEHQDLQDSEVNKAQEVRQELLVPLGSEGRLDQLVQWALQVLLEHLETGVKLANLVYRAHQD